MIPSSRKYRGNVIEAQLGDRTCAQVKYRVFAWDIENPSNTIQTDFVRPQRDGVGAIDELEIEIPLAPGAAVEVSVQDGRAIVTLIDSEKYAFAECTG